jgi:hypothetical protein
LEVSLTQHQMNSTNDPQSFAHGLSGAPTGLMFFGVGLQSGFGPPRTVFDSIFSLGMWSANGKFAAGSYSANNLSTTISRRVLSTDVVFLRSESAINRSFTVQSTDAINVNVEYVTTLSSLDFYFFMLAIRGAKCQVGTFDCNGSLDPLTIATPGITPKLFLPVFVSKCVDFLGSVQADAMLTIGASDGTNNVSCGITDQNGVTTTNARRFQSSTTLCEYNTAGTKVFESASTFSGESVILDPTTNSSNNFGQGGYLILGS